VRKEDIMAAIAKHKITPCLWFDTQAEEAARFYCSIFKDSKISKISRYTKAGQDVHHKPPGSVMVVEFEIEGQTFTALNGGPNFKFNEPSHSRCAARRKPKSIISGASSRKVARRAPAAG
jgi:predicted 3-demethylubiquinone-9 3-methyltransferase (glyoxalase superfamily)